MASQVVAVLGASGFIGNRIVEVLHLGGKYKVRPIVRRASGLALASRFPIDGRVADAFDVAALESALSGCDIVVHAIAGNADTIVRSVPSVCEAASRAGCRRLVYLSSAMVHGQAPPPDCDETAPLSKKQPLRYNNAKVRAEERLRILLQDGDLEFVILRPGIVYGPRSQWIGGIADDLIAGRAYLVDGGPGLCNGVYVDNLVDAVIRCFDTPQAKGETFLIGEQDVPTWREFYGQIAAALGIDVTSIPWIDFVPAATSLKDRLDGLRRTRAVRAALSTLPEPLQRGMAAFWEAAGALPAQPPPGPNATLELAMLQRAKHVPSWDKARRLLGYEPPISSTEAWRRTLDWLRFAGYPVEDRHG